MRSPIITLSLDDCALADDVGRERQREAVERNRKPDRNAANDPETALAMHILGARGELAAKRWLDPIPWNALYHQVRGLPDLGEDIDIKAVDKAHHRMMLKPEPEPNWAYLLAKGMDHPTWLMVGWITGAEAKSNPAWLGEPVAGRSTITVPTEALCPLQELWSYVERFYHGGSK